MNDLWLRSQSRQRLGTLNDVLPISGEIGYDTLLMNAMLSLARNKPTPSGRSEKREAGHTLWIDGVGCFWLLGNDRVTIGGPEQLVQKVDEPNQVADIALLSDLNRLHATIVRTGEGYLLEAKGEAHVGGRKVVDRIALSHNMTIELGRSVRLRFQQPSALSLSARLDFISDHRPKQAADGIILLADTCLLGPSEDQHIVCSDWPGQVLLVRQKQDLLCRSRMDFTVNGHRVQGSRKLTSGDIVMTDELRFRIEAGF